MTQTKLNVFSDKLKEMVFREGYWYNKNLIHSTRQFPTPVAQTEPWFGQEYFINALERVEKKVEGNYFRGSSSCRICGQSNGSAEYVAVVRKGIKWVWPSGYMHYIAEHNVRPSLAFQEFIQEMSIHIFYNEEEGRS